MPSRWRYRTLTKIRWRQKGGHLDAVIGRPITGRPHELMKKVVGFHLTGFVLFVSEQKPLHELYLLQYQR